MEPLIKSWVIISCVNYGVHGELKKRVVALLAMSAFFNLLGASKTCADFCDPTAVFRLNNITIISNAMQCNAMLYI
jgi:hypothetical protein